MNRYLPHLPLCLCFTLALLCSLRLGASLVVELNLTQLHQRAGAILHGRCIAQREVPDGKPLAYTEYTFEVKQAIRGCRDTTDKVVERITFRHAGTSQPRKRDDGLEEAPGRWGIPRYAVGEEAVLFLTRESALGLCAPVGLEQGKFAVIQKGRRKLISNPRGKKLFASVDMTKFHALTALESATLEAGEETLDLDCFLGLCTKLKAE